MPQMGYIGQGTDHLDTPVLLVDLEVMAGNIERLARTIIHDAGVGWRPHTKGMKSPALAHMLLAAGAHGVTCAKLGEAEVMAAAGIRDILVANQVVGPMKVARLANLQRHAEVIVAVDSLENVEELHRAALARDVRIGVAIEVDTGMRRAGVLPGALALGLAQQIVERRGLRLAGLVTWESIALRVEDPEEKRRVVLAALAQLTDTAQRCRDAGIAVDIVSCGGTGTYWLSAFAPGITEVQAGGGVLGDVNYRRNFGVDLPQALSVLSTVTSRPTPHRVIFDAGLKSMAAGLADCEWVGGTQVERVWLSAEHGTIEMAAPADTPRVGDRIELIPGYGDLTVSLHDELFGVRDGVVERVFPVLGRGRSQ